MPHTMHICTDEAGNVIPYGVIPVNPNVATVVPLNQGYPRAIAQANATVDVSPVAHYQPTAPQEQQKSVNPLPALCLVGLAGCALVYLSGGNSGPSQSEIDNAVLRNTIQIQQQQIRDFEMQRLGASQGY